MPTAEKGLPVPERLDSMQSTKILFSERTGHDDPDWLRAWPFGPVHYSEDWSRRLDGRFDTVCGKSPYYWPESDWPEHEVCPECKAWVDEHGTAAPMRYQARVIPSGARLGSCCLNVGADACVCANPTTVFPSAVTDAKD